MISLLKSSVKDTFKNWLSFVLIVIFFALTFGVLFGNISANYRFEAGIYNTGISNNLFQADIDTSRVSFKTNADGTYDADLLNNYFQTSNSELPTIINDLTEEELVNYLDTNIFSEQGYSWSEDRMIFDSDLDTFLLLWGFEHYSEEYNISYSYQTYYLNKDITDPNHPKYQINIRGNNIDSTSSNFYTKSIFQNYVNNEENNVVNKFDIVEGRLPESGKNEIALNASFAKKNDIEVGDRYNSSEVTGLIRVPNFLYPAMSITATAVDYNNQSIVLMPYEDYNSKTFATNDIRELSSTIYFGWNDIFNEVDSYNSFYDQKELISDRVADFNNFISEFFEVDNSNNSEMAYAWFDISLPQNYRVYAAFNRAEVTKGFNRILLLIFFVIFIVIFYITLKKKINENSKQLGTLKALGLKRRKIALLYITYPALLVICGFLFAVLFGLFIHSIWFTVSVKYFELSYGAFKFGTLAWMMITLIPIVLFTLMSFIMAILMLKKSPLYLINNVTKNKPNFLIPLVSKPLRNKSFTTTYTIKNGLRSLTKSAIIIAALFFSIFLMLMSFALEQAMPRTIASVSQNISFNQLSTYYNSPNDFYYLEYDSTADDIYSTLESSEFETINQNQYYIIDSLSKVQLATYELDIEQAKHDFSTQVIDYLLANPIISTNESESELNISYIDSQVVLALTSWDVLFLQADENNSNNFSLGQYYDGDNIPTSTVSNKAEKLPYEDLYSNTIFNLVKLFDVKAFANYAQENQINLSELDLSEITLDDLADIKADFSEIYSNTRIYFGVNFYDPNFETLASSSLMYSEEDQLASRMYIFDSVDNLSKNYSLVDSNKNNITSNLEDAQSSDYSYVPIIVPSYLKVVSNGKISEGKEFRYDFLTGGIKTKDNRDLEESYVINFKVVGVYESYLPIGSFLIEDDLSNYLVTNYASDFGTDANNIIYGHNLKYNYSFDFSQLTDPFLIMDSKIEYYSEIDSTTGFTNYFLLNYNDAQNVYEQPLQYLTTSRIAVTSEEIIKTSLSSLSAIVKVVLAVFAGVTLIIGVTLIFIFIKEIIDSSTNEIATLKVFGYSALKATMMVIIPYVIILSITFIVAVPLVILLLHMVSHLVYISAGLVIPLYPSALQIFVTGLILFVAVSLMLYVGYIIFKNTPAIKALENQE